MLSGMCVAASDADVDASPPADGLIGYWPFDGDGVDATGGGHSAQLIANPVFVPGHLGSALQFDSTNYVQVPSFNGSAFPPSGTLAFWIDSQFGVATSIVDEYRTDSPHFFVRLTAPNTMQFACMNTSTVFPNNAYVNLPVVSGPHHLALAWSTSPPMIQLYLDKQDRGMKDATGWLGPTGEVVQLMKYLPGTMDELRLYDRVLTQQELDALP